MLTEQEQNDEWRLHSEQLAKKSIAALTGYVDKNSAGKVSDRELCLIADALYDAVLGIVPMDIADTIYAVRQEALQNARTKRAGS